MTEKDSSPAIPKVSKSTNADIFNALLVLQATMGERMKGIEVEQNALKHRLSEALSEFRRADDKQSEALEKVADDHATTLRTQERRIDQLEHSRAFDRGLAAGIGFLAGIIPAAIALWI